MTISLKMRAALKGGSMVRKMFEEGRELKGRFGENNVFDYSLGNPDLEPPEAFKTKVIELINQNEKGLHGYMPNGGLDSVRHRLAGYLSKIHGENIGPEMVIMTVGAAGAINVALKTIVETGDEVMVLAPFFMEYAFYADNHGAKIVAVDSHDNFRPDLGKISEAITEKTRALIINSPNNPTGVVYTLEELKGLADLLRDKSKKYSRPVLLISDEPYRKIVFGGLEVPSVLSLYEDSVVVTSFSKDLSLAGERIGYICVNPKIKNSNDFISAATLANRILGFVNAPALAQRVVAELLEESVDIRVYQERVNSLAGALRGIGYDLVDPQGTFYLFPKSPMKDDLAFIEVLKKELILAVPGSGFSRPGYFRLSLCLDLDKINRSIDGFKRAYHASLAQLRV
ncbi:MAG: pyridoxal phosphate-dependent aminotransferase [Deltaproteobacteria bacterium]|jgi:aspartate aminotransferase|nr:pyridoxal phosphate-dependent aminotransferase [Deltaproteobacteria bacterium]